MNKPNILILMSDQHTARLMGCAGTRRWRHFPISYSCGQTIVRSSRHAPWKGRA
jgi:hypothetical protein